MHVTSPCRWYPELGCHQQGVCQGQRRSARTDKPASSQIAVSGSLCGSSVGSTRTRQGRSKGCCSALETRCCFVPYQETLGESLTGCRDLGCHLICIGGLGSGSRGAQSTPQPLRGAWIPLTFSSHCHTLHRSLMCNSGSTYSLR